MMPLRVPQKTAVGGSRLLGWMKPWVVLDLIRFDLCLKVPGDVWGGMGRSPSAEHAFQVVTGLRVFQIHSTR